MPNQTIRCRALRRGHDGRALRHRHAVFDAPEAFADHLHDGVDWFEIVASDTPLNAGDESLDLAWAEVSP